MRCTLPCCCTLRNGARIIKPLLNQPILPLSNHRLGDIRERILLSLDTLNILLLKQDVNALFDIGHTGPEPGLKLSDNLSHQRTVLHDLASLHDTDNGGLHQQLTILLNGLVSLLGLDLLFCLDRQVQVDTDLLAIERQKCNKKQAAISTCRLLLINSRARKKSLNTNLLKSMLRS